eukprot:TRINITY_DN14029_c0_g1_i1.p1 TRINITY_DN14029_c0_g1~~TRINITY_DN14029_c0_g1_i1.p1  ORF type:complete len:866 (+),score=178.40 TRINITY_DN14029_c0_g1_i1:82-2679(+)
MFSNETSRKSSIASFASSTPSIPAGPPYELDIDTVSSDDSEDSFGRAVDSLLETLKDRLQAAHCSSIGRTPKARQKRRAHQRASDQAIAIVQAKRASAGNSSATTAVVAAAAAAAASNAAAERPKQQNLNAVGCGTAERPKLLAAACGSSASLGIPGGDALSVPKRHSQSSSRSATIADQVEEITHVDSLNIESDPDDREAKGTVGDSAPALSLAVPDRNLVPSHSILSSRSGVSRFSEVRNNASFHDGPGCLPHPGRVSDSDFHVLEMWQEQTRTSRRNHSLTSRSIVRQRSSVRSSFSISDELALELKAAQRQNHRRVQCLRRCVISPSSLKRFAWELLATLFVIHEVISVPLVAFGHYSERWQGFFLVASWIGRIFWIFDILYHFFVGFTNSHGIVEAEPYAIAKQYIRSRFFFDSLVVACDWTEAIADFRGDSRIKWLRLTRMVRTYRLVRQSLDQEIIDFVQDWVRSESLRVYFIILGNILTIVALTHCIACAWHWLHMRETARDTEPCLISFEACYVDAYHYALSFYDGGLYELQRTNGERVFTIAAIFVSLVVSTAFVGSLTTAMTRLQMLSSARANSFAVLSRFLNYHNVSRQLAVRIHRNAHHAIEQQGRTTPESSVELLQFVSKPLIFELHVEMHAPILESHPFFCFLHKTDGACERQVCHKALDRLQLESGDSLFYELEVPVNPKMYFVASGDVSYQKDASNVFLKETVEAGKWLSEAYIWTAWAHLGSARCTGHCELLVLDIKKFQKIIGASSPSRFYPYADLFVSRLNSHPEALTDVGMDDGSTADMIRQAYPEYMSEGEADAADTTTTWAFPLKKKQQPNRDGSIRSNGSRNSLLEKALKTIAATAPSSKP